MAWTISTSSLVPEHRMTDVSAVCHKALFGVGAQVDEGMERVLPFDGANFLRLVKPRLQALCVNLGRVASNPSQFSLDHIGGQPPKAQAQVRVDRAGDDETRPEGVRVRDVERTGTRNQLKLELATEPGRLGLDPLDGPWSSTRTRS